ncbi:ubiquinol oxidase subunit II [Marinobacter sp. F3R08]|uniref:ubiquinol oxidase subunit II n=1 Tax=Marinobacter sp. F3R08 TaxID=2841559 RepID=UPI001C09416F|nr:ubiquinol oxidase subunit II [Marinobacter sp. F3R08]MBU2954375.1 ubiquinol oxidase subunit II [Marinobacter sp. F3R08]
MKRKNHLRTLGGLMAPALPLLLSGCSSALMDPKGQIAEEQRLLIITAFALMLIVVIPVIVMTLLFAYRYRDGNSEASYKPNWAHSTAIEVVVWLVPCLIILALAILTWVTSHSLNPKSPIPTDNTQKSIEIQAVSLDWKWLFIYPEQGIATVNEVAFPVDKPIHFRITSGSVMNSFWIPTLGTQIYAMAGMDSSLHLIADEKGSFDGRSTNYSGAGFSEMTFKAHSLSRKAFEDWAAKVRASGDALSFTGEYQKLAEPSTSVPVQYFSTVTPELYNHILDSFRKPHKRRSEHGENRNAVYGDPVNAEPGE